MGVLEKFGHKRTDVIRAFREYSQVGITHIDGNDVVALLNWLEGRADHHRADWSGAAIIIDMIAHGGSYMPVIDKDGYDPSIKRARQLIEKLKVDLRESNGPADLENGSPGEEWSMTPPVYIFKMRR